MNKLPVRQFSSFRETFVSKLAHRDTKAWYPGHMYKGMLQMQAKLAIVDCILEVHDARIPFSGRNPKFYTMLTAVKPHVLILNKSDMIDSSAKKKITEILHKQNVPNVLFTDCKSANKSGVQKIIPTVSELVENSDLFNRANKSHINVMIIGVPNVGKSSVINKLRNINLNRKKGSHVGAIPGITKSVLEKIKISEKPLIYLYDTPGVVEPCINHLEDALRLALCRTLKDSQVGEELMADYLLYWLNKHSNFSYVKYLQLTEPTDDIRILLMHIARQKLFVVKRSRLDGSAATFPDFLESSRYFVKAFREGEFGKIILDIDKLNKFS